jgi:hypothetical protein
MVEEAVAMVEEVAASVVAAAISVVAVVISLVAVVILLGFAGHSFAEHQGAHFARHGDHFRHDGDFFFGGPFGYGDAYSYDYPYYGYNNYNDGDYYDGQYSPAEVTPSQETIVAVQRELAKLGYYHGPIDGLIGPQTGRAISWFQSVDKLPVTGRIDDPTLEALQIS